MFYVPDLEEGAMLVFNDNGNWLCDCGNFVANMVDSGKNPECSHIRAVKGITALRTE